MEMVGIDLFQTGGKHFIAMIDRFSGFPFVRQLTSLNSQAIIKCLDNWFKDFGFPSIIRTDGGPQFRSEFAKYCWKKQIVKETSSAYYAQSNGLAECGVKQMKFLVKKTNQQASNLDDALLAWRNTPRADGTSPAQMMFGFTQNFGQPFKTKPLFVDRKTIAASRLSTEQQNAERYNARSKTLEKLEVGDHVEIQDPKTQQWTSSGTITETRPDDRSYQVASDHQKLGLRNRKHLRRSPRLIETAREKKEQ